MRNFTSDNVDVINLDADQLASASATISIPIPSARHAGGVQGRVEWDNYGLLVVDSALIYSIVDVLLGGRRGTAAMRIEGRPYTTIERRAGRAPGQVFVLARYERGAFDPDGSTVAISASTGWKPIPEIRNHREARATPPCWRKLRVDMEDRGGRIELMVPYATLEPVREMLLQMFMGEKFGRDSIWENHLASEMWETRLDLEAVLDEQTMSLIDVMRLRVGSQLRLNAKPDSKITLRCGNVPLLTGQMGRVGERVAVQVEQRLPSRSEDTADV